jgi:Fe-Mn family superoxide dismutase
MRNMNKKILDNDLDLLLKNVVKNSISKQTSDLPKETLEEAYVAEPKVFKQVSEFSTQKTKDAHDGLYKGYVEALNKISAQIDSADRTAADSKHSNYRSLKIDETYNLNATWLHELYFANAFDPHSEITMDSLSFMRLERDFGTFEDWQRDFIACAMSSGNGWAVCGYHMFLQRYVNTFITSHSCDVMLGLYPIIVIDMWEHAYYRDYLSDKKSHLVARMREFNWNVIEERVQKAESIASVLKVK